MRDAVLSLAAWTARVLPLSIKRQIYRQPWLASKLRDTLNRAAPAGLTLTTVAAGRLKGAQLYLDLQTEKDYWLGTYEPDLQDAAIQFVQPGSIIYDIGANIGYVSLLLARCTGAGGKVFSFEALPQNLERLSKNLALNGSKAQVEIVPVAVVDQNRKVRFLVGPSGGMGKAEGSAGRQEIEYSDAIETQGISLDDFVYAQGNPAPAVVKMDIEGGEVMALPGMVRLLREAHPLIFLELHGRQAAQAAWKILTEHGYSLSKMEKNYPQVQALDSLDWKSYIVAFPARPFPNVSTPNPNSTTLISGSG